MNYLFDSDLAVRFGVDEAIMIANFQYWIRKNEVNGKHLHDGRYWTYNSVDAFTKLFPFWSGRQIRRILKSLIDKGVIVTGNYNTSAYDRTTWYAFGDSFLLNEFFHFTDSSNGNTDVVTSNIYITNNKPDSKPYIAAEGGSSDSPAPTASVKVEKPRGTSEPTACLFANSRFCEFEDFAEQFKKPEFNEVDIVYYYHAVADWSAQKGKKMKDWIATARNFIRSDIERGKLHKVINNPEHCLSPDALQYLQDMAD